MNYLPKYPPSEHDMVYWRRFKDHINLQGLTCMCKDDVLYFQTQDMVKTFEQRVRHLRMRNEMKEDYEKLDLEGRKKFAVVFSEFATAPCFCHSLFNCHHFSYEKVVKLHDLLCNTPSPTHSSAFSRDAAPNRNASRGCPKVPPST
jgi:hypothetical protein